MTTYTTRYGTDDAGSAVRIYEQLPTGELGPCPGAAHSNAYIDHCGVCAPRWGQVEVLHPVDLAAAAREGILVACGHIADDLTLDALLKDPSVQQVTVRVRSRGCTTTFSALRLPRDWTR